MQKDGESADIQLDVDPEVEDIQLNAEDEGIVQAVRESVDLQRKRQPSTAEEQPTEAAERLTDQDKSPEVYLEGEPTEVRNITTAKGDVKVEIHGDLKLPAIVSYHDVGLNAKTAWNGFVNYPGIDKIFARTCLINFIAPGQHENATALHARYKPTINDLVDQVKEAIGILGVRYFVAMGVGSGAHVMLHYALQHPKPVRGLIFISGNASSEGFFTWGKGLMNKAMWSEEGPVPERVVNGFVAKFFSKDAVAANTKLVQKYKEEIAKLNPANLAHYAAVVNARTNLLKRVNAELKCPLLLITGKEGPNHDNVMELYSRLAPAECAATLVEIPGAGDLCHIENPEPIREALHLWLFSMNI